ncbi:MAG: leucyl aminopeptidase [Vulcanimicrobiaceae bacterium]
MHVRSVQDSPLSVRVGALIVPLFTDGVLDGATEVANDALGGAVADIVAAGEHKGKLGEMTLVHAKEHPFRRLIVVGLGEREKFEPLFIGRAVGAAVRAFGRKGIKEFAVALPPKAKGHEAACASFAAEGAITSTFDLGSYQKDTEKNNVAESLSILSEGFDAQALAAGIARGHALGTAINLARRLANTPANDMTPTHLGKEALAVGKATGVQVDVHDAAWAEKHKMGSFLSVAQGSVQPPAFIVMTYKGDPSSKELLALVGKGITFDTGGISIKPAAGMEDMKMDMSGAAGVIATMHALGTLKPKVNVVAIAPATENMPDGKSTKPGDIVRAMNGTTIEVINTDAEGRLVLCDALTYAQSLGATKIIDCATLTGACVIALGHAASAAMTNDDAFLNAFLAATKHTGERYWHMPLFDDYTQAMKSDIADLKNTGGRAAGTLTAGAFLKTFIEKTPWIHLDIAGTAYVEKETAWLSKGAQGVPVRALVAYAEALAANGHVG